MIRKQKGFTLIELLVVIAIIGLLASVIMVSLANARSKARDTKRIADVEQMMKALELYYSINGQYPASGGSTAPNGTWSGSNNASWDTLQTAMSQAIGDLPEDPQNSASGWAGTAGTFVYSYYAGCNRQAYAIVYRLENPSMKQSPGVNVCGTVLNYSGTVTIGQSKM